MLSSSSSISCSVNSSSLKSLSSLIRSVVAMDNTPPTVTIEHEIVVSEKDEDPSDSRLSVNSEELSIISLSCLFGESLVRNNDDDLEKNDERRSPNILDSGLRSMMKNKLFKMRHFLFCCQRTFQMLIIDLNLCKTRQKKFVEERRFYNILPESV